MRTKGMSGCSAADVQPLSIQTCRNYSLYWIGSTIRRRLCPLTTSSRLPPHNTTRRHSLLSLAWRNFLPARETPQSIAICRRVTWWISIIV